MIRRRVLGQNGARLARAIRHIGAGRILSSQLVRRGTGDVFLSHKTVKNYVSSIPSKLNVQRRPRRPRVRTASFTWRGA